MDLIITVTFGTVMFLWLFLSVQIMPWKTETSCSLVDSIKECFDLVKVKGSFCHWLQLLRCHHQI